MFAFSHSAGLFMKRFYLKKSAVTCALITVLPVSISARAHGACVPVDGATKVAVDGLLRRSYGLRTSAAVSLLIDTPIERSCFRRLIYRVETATTLWDTSLFLSPDHRFASSDFLKLGGDDILSKKPVQEIRAELMQGDPPLLGDPKAPVSLVEFVDFQCPFCKRFVEQIESDVMTTRGHLLQLIVRQLPLRSHTWALAAAEESVCVRRQSSDAFWSFYQFLFLNQSSLNEKNLLPESIEYLSNTLGLNVDKFKSCLHTGAALPDIRRDVDLAFLDGIEATPTSFINGHRIDGMIESEELLHMIDVLAAPEKLEKQ